MPPRMTVEPHLTLKELKKRYRTTTEPTLRSHYHMVWLVADGRTVTETADLLGFARQWVARVIHRYNKLGPDGLGDQRHKNTGHPGILTDEIRAELAAALAGPPPEGARWSGPAVTRWLEARLSRKIYVQRAYEWAAQVGHPIQRARD